MNKRLTTRSLAELLSNQTGLSRKHSEDFIEALSSYFSQSLEKNKVVKIVGLGVFKIMLVRERESVHIQSGERFVIPAHHKLTFIPDKNFKEQINRPFALFEPIEAPESHLLEFDSLRENEMYIPELYESFSETGEPFQYYPETSEESAVLEDDYLETSEGSPAYEDDYLESSEGSPAYEESTEESVVYEDDLPELTAENAAYEESTEENAVYDDEWSESTQNDSGITYNVDYFDNDMVNEDFINNDEEPYFEDFANGKVESDDNPAELEYDEPAIFNSKYEILENDETDTSESFYDELPYDVVAVSTTYTNRSNEADTSVSEKTDERYNDKEEDIDSESHFLSPDKKKRKALLWFFLIVIPLLCLFGSVLGGYYFVKQNSDKTQLGIQNQEISNITSLTNIPSPIEIEVVPEPADVQQDNTLPENNTSDTNTTRRPEVQRDTDWLVALPESNRTSEVRRVNGPNSNIESQNRALTNNTRQATTANTARATTDSRNSTTSTATNTRSLPRSIRMPAGETLTSIALQYYGDKVFWVYIYEHNKNNIKNFDSVPVGMEIQLPTPSAYGIDSKSAASLQRARVRQSQLVTQ